MSEKDGQVRDRKQGRDFGRFAGFDPDRMAIVLDRRLFPSRFGVVGAGDGPEGRVEASWSKSRGLLDPWWPGASPALCVIFVLVWLSRCKRYRDRGPRPLPRGEYG